MNIALVAHDGRKQELLEWVEYNYKVLENHTLWATGTTGKLIEKIGIEKPERKGYLDWWRNADEYELKNYTGTTYPIEECYDHPFKGRVSCLLSGPLGGDQQIGAMIAEGKIDMLIFFCDNLIMQGHQNDVSALTRLASLYNIAFATNRTTADMILTSTLFGSKEYKRIIPGVIENYRNRKL